MAAFATTNVFLYMGGHDFTCDSNVIRLMENGTPKDVTTMCDDSTVLIGGVKKSAIEYAGFWQAGADQVDPDAYGTVNVPGQVVTFGPVVTETGAVRIVRAMTSTYVMGGDHGEPMPFSVSAVGSSGEGAIVGQLAVEKADVTSTGAVGSGCQFVGGVATGESLYATLHVFSPGTTITAVLESDDNAGFTSATTRATFSAVTTKSGNWATAVAGPITDDYYRIRVTSITGTFNMAAAIGIG